VVGAFLMAVVDDKLNEYCVYWAPLPEGPEGQPVLDDPVEMRCRWSYKEQFVQTKTGEVVASLVSVITETPTLENGWLWRGTMSQLDDQSDPRNDPGAFRIQVTRDTTDVDATEHVYRAFL
jgi:hypothetical protein